MYTKRTYSYTVVTPYCMYLKKIVCNKVTSSSIILSDVQVFLCLFPKENYFSQGDIILDARIIEVYKC